MKKFSLAAGSCALIFGLYSSLAHADNLVEVYEQALQNDPTFKEAQATWMAAKENIPISAANLLPALDVNGTLSRIYSDLGGSTTYTTGTQYNLTVGQPIINFAYLANLRGAKASTKAATATYAAAAQNLMFRTAQAYLAVMKTYDDLHFTLA
ncbi:MAG TPA: TolC family protein, partial [Coxiellaceae bacterium]|nr:TolC family protein [Coxiellaceae bacterium]